jgi:nucleotide-binding universal stress UspA family protein
MPAAEHRAGHRIVAGVDGSPSSLSALRWAVRQARLTGATVDAVITWHYPVSEGGYGSSVIGTGKAFDFREAAEKVLADAISTVGDPGSDPGGGIPVRARVIEGNAAQVLIDASAGADLLVVGSRGHGGFTEALLGSVGQHCVQHAHCPVVVVRGQE